MPRPKTYRWVRHRPEITFFKPHGIPVWMLEHVTLTLAEVEALRLSDLEGLYQEDAAEKMGVSRQTFGRVLKEARAKIAGSIVHGKALKIEGGSYRMLSGFYHCKDCGARFPMPWCFPVPKVCPECGSTRVVPEEELSREPEQRPGLRKQFGRGRHGPRRNQEGTQR
jgi:predicted DNA-binding protein (UPF0251 family)